MPKSPRHNRPPSTSTESSDAPDQRAATPAPPDPGTPAPPPQTQTFTQRGRVSLLRAENTIASFEFDQQGKKFRLPIDAANYNAKYSMLLSAAINGSSVEVEATILADATTGRYTMVAVTLV